MNKKSMAVLGVAAAAFSTACISILGDFQVGACPAGEAIQGTVCVPTEGGTPPPTSCSDSNAPVCDAKRVCSDTAGKAVCICKPEFAGAECGVCGDGLQDNDGDGTCENTCAKAAPTCGDHAACADTSGTPTCVCVPGYGASGEGACAFTAGPVDPDFTGTPANAWTIVDGSIDPGDAGTDASSVARMSACADGWGTVKQKFLMPGLADSQPAALKVRARGYCTPGASPCYGGSINVGSNLALTTMTVPGGGLADSTLFGTASMCLGERASGPDVAFELSSVTATGSYFCTSSTPGTRVFEVDNVSVVPDPTCPPFAAVLNGNFEANGGWVVAGGGSVEPLLGNNNSKAGRLVDSVKCPGTPASITGGASFPSASVPNTALQFTFKGTNTKPAAVDFSGFALAGNMVGTGTYQDVTVCVPEGLKGFVAPIRLHHLSVSALDCGTTADPRESVFDELRFASAPTLCPAKAFINDGSFERSDPGAPWTFSSSYSASAAVANGGTTAHEGSRYLYLQPYLNCANGNAATIGTVPPAEGTAGPAVKFFYKLAPGTVSTFNASWNTGTSYGSTPLTTATTVWTEGKMCLPPAQAGRIFNLTFTASTSATGTCGTSVAGTGNMSIDDISVGTDATCPATP